MGSSMATSPLLRACLLFGALHLACGARLQWNVTGPYVNFPFGYSHPPFVLRTTEGPDPDKVVIVSDSASGGWTLSAYQTDTGKSVWNSTLENPDGGSNGVLYTITSGTTTSQQQNNTVSLLFMQLGAYVVAVNASDGSKLWQHSTYNQSTPKITAYGDASNPGIVYLASPFINSSRPIPAPINYIEALDAATGQLKWSNFTPPPPNSGLAASDTAATWGVTPLPGLVVYAQGSRMYGISSEDGRQLWEVVLAGGATGLGQNANVTSVTFVEAAPPARPYPLLLLSSATWDQTRFMTYQFNGSSPAEPPSRLWQLTGNQNFEGSLSDGLARLGLAVPQVSIDDNLFVIWSNRTSYDIFNGGKPLYNTYLVARSLSTGEVVWAQNTTALGLSKQPVSPPTVYLGVLSVVTSAELVVMDAGSGKVRFTWSAAPYQPQANGGSYSYVPTTSFAEGWGQLALVRCLGSSSPGTLCAYNGYDNDEPVSAAQRQRPPAGAAALAAAAAAAVLAAALGGLLL